MRLSEKFGFLAVTGFFFQRIAPKLVANLLVNINSGVLGVLLMIFFDDPICVQPNETFTDSDSVKHPKVLAPSLSSVRCNAILSYWVLI